MKHATLAACLLIATQAQAEVSLEFRGATELPQDLTIDGDLFGGISGMTYVAREGIYYAVGDDLTNARYFTLSIDIADGTLDDGDITVLSATRLRDIDQRPFPSRSVDPEGIVLLPDDTLLIAAETVGDKFPAFVRQYRKDGTHLSALPVDHRRYDPRFDPERGSRRSGGYESIVLDPDGRTIYTAFEVPLKQDVPDYDSKRAAPVRIKSYDWPTGEKLWEHVYFVGTSTITPDPVDGWYGRGLNDLLYLAPGRFLTVERQIAQGTTSGTGSRPVEIFEISLAGATDVTAVDTLTGDETPVKKALALDLEGLRDAHGLARVGNYEVLTLGPQLPDGARSLIMIEDNDFERPTQAVLFALSD